MPAAAWTEALQPVAEGVAVDVEVAPGADRTEFPSGFNPWRRRILVRVAAPPTEGQANEALLATVAGFFHVPTSRVRLLSGARSRQKRVLIVGVDAAAARARIGEALGGPR